MRFNEFSNAQDQLALVKLIFDNTWAALAQQAEEQKRAKALAKPPKKSKRIAKPKIPAPPKPKPPKPIAKPAVKAEPQSPQRFNTAASPKSTAPAAPQNTSNVAFDAYSAKNDSTKKSFDSVDDRYSLNGDTNLKRLLRIFRQVST